MTKIANSEFSSSSMVMPAMDRDRRSHLGQAEDLTRVRFSKTTLRFTDCKLEDEYQNYYYDTLYYRSKRRYIGGIFAALAAHWIYISSSRVDDSMYQYKMLYLGGVHEVADWKIDISNFVLLSLVATTWILIAAFRGYRLQKCDSLHFQYCMVAIMQGCILLAYAKQSTYISTLLSEIQKMDKVENHQKLKEAMVLHGLESLHDFTNYLFIGICIFGCMVHIQFVYYIVVCLESFASLLFLMIRFPIYDISMWQFMFRLVILCTLIGFSSRNIELHKRKEFCKYRKWTYRNRKLTDQNIVMREELSQKIVSHSKFEMEGVLRVLVHIKKKVSQEQRGDIDRIIHVLVSTRDLFQVNLDNYIGRGKDDDELIGWLAMMDHDKVSKDNSPQAGVSVRTASQFNFFVGNFLRELFSNQDRVNDFNTKLQNDFHIDIFDLAVVCPSPLAAVVVGCISANSLERALELNLVTLMAFSKEIERNYSKSNAYHNPLHAASVVLDMCYHMSHLKEKLDDLGFFAGLIAAAVHDIAHPGVSNRFLIQTSSKLSITYSDDSVLERMHLAEAFRLLSQPQFNIYSGFSSKDYEASRKLIIQMVMSTDLSQHFHHVTKLKALQFIEKKADKVVPVDVALSTLIMLADIGHAAKPFKYHSKWVDLVSEEFFRQGDLELVQGLPVSPLCNRNCTNIPKSQVGFFKMIALPLFEVSLEVIPMKEFNAICDCVRQNTNEWSARC